MNNRVRWRVSALASAVALLGSIASIDAHALALGRITVQSALGEPLRAEIDIAEITADEANSLKAGVASAEAFKTAGLEYTSAVTGVEVTLQKRADGRSFLRLSSTRAVTEPFVDLVLDASWSSGRVMRDYTLLFDPPAQRNSAVAAAPIAPVAPMLSRPLPPASARATPASPSGVAPANPAPSAAQARPAPVAKAPVGSPASRAPSGGQQVTVKQGDTAGKIATQNKPGNVSLDQMLVALLLNNPNAFSGGNINRLKSGALLDMPAPDQAESIPQAEASRTIVAQSRSFNDFRRKLAENVPAAQVDSANRQAGGKVQAKVEDRAPATATPDKLTLSKGALQSKTVPAEEKIAKDRQAREASSRVAELSKNIGDLNRMAGPATPAATVAGPGVAVPNPGLTTAKAPGPVPSPPVAAPNNAKATAPASVPVPSGAAVPAAVQAPVATPTTAVAATSTTTGLTATPVTTTAASATATAAGPAPALAASAPVLAASQAAAVPAPSIAPVPVAVKKRLLPPPPPPETSFIEELTESPFLLPGFGALLLLLAGFGFYRYKKRDHNAVQVDSSFLESRLQPDSFFGASGGQHVDTNEGGATGSSLVYSPSQLDAAGDVDPVAEADVYLAYGRDLQAEEILKEAIRTSPTRVAIHSKLMEIYAKRRDIKAFEVVAIEAFSMTRGEGPEWAYIAEMGRNLDPANPMYQPGGQPSAVFQGGHASSRASNASSSSASTLAQPIEAQATAASAPVDFDLDLDFSDEPAVAAPTPPARAVAPVAPAKRQPEPEMAHKTAPPEAMFDGLAMDFSAPAETPKPSRPALSAPSLDLDAGNVALADEGLSFTADTPVTKAAPVSARKAAPAAAAPALDNGMLEFDLASLSLDLPGSSAETSASAIAAAPAAASDDPLETKFALAEEFRALGDMDGARSLAEEVAAEATGSLKSKSKAFLNALS
jgi:pilus assembly protein FimV